MANVKSQTFIWHVNIFWCSWSLWDEELSCVQGWIMHFTGHTILFKRIYGCTDNTSLKGGITFYISQDHQDLNTIWWLIFGEILLSIVLTLALLYKMVAADIKSFTYKAQEEKTQNTTTQTWVIVVLHCLAFWRLKTWKHSKSRMKLLNYIVNSLGQGLYLSMHLYTA